MHTQQLTTNQLDRSHDVERSDQAAIAGEIAARLTTGRDPNHLTQQTTQEICSLLIELKDKFGEQYTVTLISKIHALTQIRANGAPVVWTVLGLMSGDLSALTQSYASMGKEHARSKQAVQQEIERIAAALKLHYPPVAEALIQLRHITADTNESGHQFKVKVEREL